MAAYAEAFPNNQFESLPRKTPSFGVRDEPERTGGAETLGLASGFEMEGDTLQTATQSIRDRRVQKKFDPELGMVIGEVTDLEPYMEPVQIEAVAPVAAAAPVRAAPAPARPAMYGIGMKIADTTPFKILSVNNLRDAQDKSLNHMVESGDILDSIDGQNINNLSIEEVELRIFSNKDTMVTLTLWRPRTSQQYTVQVRRHIPIQFALGMSISVKVPHSVIRVDELLDEHNQNISHLVGVGDYLESIDGKPVESLGLKPLEHIIFGPIDSIIQCAFKKAGTGQVVELALKRHIPVVSWMRWEEQGGMGVQQQQAAPPPPVPEPVPTVQAAATEMNGGASLASLANAAPPGVRGDLVPQPVVGFGDDDVTGEFI